MKKKFVEAEKTRTKSVATDVIQWLASQNLTEINYDSVISTALRYLNSVHCRYNKLKVTKLLTKWIEGYKSTDPSSTGIDALSFEAFIAGLYSDLNYLTLEPIYESWIRR